ncbi:hypothetical protein BCR37DRAFT_129496 [Protomyces lactucae-debilis]|uniref:Uncharacterized protein n=1 Tax=Protomyces lactucae-debilis TaxID=2754530 RepID=A0A1Y2FUC7_PROLT|nr:uncharacterized protein BCR37DRAFT_129496 [Protomyces lactucae-debilis]ORY86894.1 hypothetical protein BCR37DRAFT_129496 [Protomyces lactucae-debilis]
MRTEHFVRDTLIAAIEADIEANKVAANDGAYFNCQTQPYGGKAWKSVDLYTDFYEPSDVLANGCGYQDPNQVIKATKPLCPDRCYTYRPCLQGVPVWRIPRTVTAAMYDRDKLLGVELKLEFETKSQVRTCGIEERLMTIIPGFLPLSFLGVGPGMFIYTIISVDCAIRFRSPPAETVHL